MKLLIVDDEPLVRNDLLSSFHWGELGIEIVGAARDGLEAVEMIKSKNPDIVLTDIKMPGIDGIGLASWIQENHAGTAVIFLTGYNDFEYAKCAIELQASNYILKPVEEDELFRVVKNAMHKIELIRDENQKYQQAIDTLNGNIAAVREKFFLDTLKGRIRSPEEIFTRSKSLKIDLNRKYFCVVAIEALVKQTGTDTSEYTSGMYRGTLKDALAAVFTEPYKCYAVEDEKDDIILILGVSDKSADCVDLVKRKLEPLIDNFSGSFELTIGLSGMHDGVERLNQCYIEAFEALYGKVYAGSGRVILYDELIHGDNASFFRLDREKLGVMLVNGDKKGLLVYLDQYFSFYKNNYNIMVKHKEFIIFEIVSSAFENLKAYNTGTEPPDYYILEKLTGFDTLEELQKQVEVFMLDSMKYFQKPLNEYSNNIVDNITAYLENNYMNNISLKTVADDFSVNLSYLSRIFYEKTGVHFTEHITNLRMDRAKKLIKNTKLNMNTISKTVGYQSGRYFSRLFKMREGITPQEYRDSTK